MNPLEKSDVKNHLSIRDLNRRRLHSVPSVADATGFSSEEPGLADVVRVPEESLRQTLSRNSPLVLAPVLVATSSKRERA